MTSSKGVLYSASSVLIVAASLMAHGTASAQESVERSQNSISSPISGSSSDAGAQDIVVTGSRVVTSGNQAPTPVTVLSAETLQQTTPMGIARAVLELPQFVGSAPERGRDLGLTNSSGAYLNLRQFGAQRNLILLDGIRIAPSTSDGKADISVIPQGLVQRVDIVTGGVSAVYGSDAITGVVNFVLDHNFNGLKAFGQWGTFRYGDGDSSRLGLTAGTPIFGGRGHIEASVEHSQLDAVADDGHRGELFAYPNNWTRGGNGTAGAPYQAIQYSRSYTRGAPGGLIRSLGDLRDITFKENGVPTPFIHGIPTPGVSGAESGGDGSYFDGMDISAPSKTNQALVRFDYDVTDDIRFYLQGSYTNFKNAYNWQQVGMTNETIFSGNPFIPDSIQEYMTDHDIESLKISKLPLTAQGYKPYYTDTFTNNMSVTTGLEGKIGQWDWIANYRYSRSLEHVRTGNNLNQEKLAAALDAVEGPNGEIVCAVSLTPEAGRFPGCQPVNLFGPTAASQASMDFVQEDTEYHLYNTLHDVNLSFSGPVFALPAGQVVAAVSGEFRHQGLTNNSTVDPTAAPNCTGIRGNCTETIYSGATTASVRAQQDVYEAAVEVQAPLLADMPLVQSLELNLAGRYTHYSVSGAAYTWKIGGIWDVTDEIRFRATRSRDIRAPTLFDLFAPASTSTNTLTDLHTGVTALTLFFRGGNNPDLKPEVGNTLTAGMVYRPNWLPGASLSVDYYDINLTDAIYTASPGNSAVQQECEDSGGGCLRSVRSTCAHSRSAIILPRTSPPG